MNYTVTINNESYEILKYCLPNIRLTFININDLTLDDDNLCTTIIKMNLTDDETIILFNEIKQSLYVLNETNLFGSNAIFDVIFMGKYKLDIHNLHQDNLILCNYCKQLHFDSDKIIYIDQHKNIIKSCKIINPQYQQHEITLHDDYVFQNASLIEDFNTLNHFNYSPYIFNSVNKQIIIDTKWFEPLNDKYKSQIMNLLQKRDITFSFDHVTNPHETEIFWEFYKLCCSWYDFNEWCTLTDNYQMYTLSDDEINTLQHLGSISDLYVSNNFHIFIETLLQHDEYKNGIFIKTGTKSCKHDHSLVRLTNEYDIIKSIISSDSMLRSFEHTNKLIFKPWNPNINNNNEFRVVIRNKKIKWISQQACYNNITTFHPDIIFLSITKFLQSVQFDYVNVVLDVFIDDNYKTNLIECNPEGLWLASGSALFHWVNDYDLLNDDKIYIRLK